MLLIIQIFIGWLKTFDEYFKDQVKNILNEMVKKLTASKDMKFIFAEISFFDKWWATIDANTKDLVKR
jgi:hypothetical protein